MKKWLTIDRFSGLFLLVSSVILFFFIIPVGVEINPGCSSTGLSPAFMPKLITFIMGFLSVLMVISSGRGEILFEQHIFSRRMLFTALIFILYIILVPKLGYLVSTLVFLPSTLVFFGTRKWAVIIPVSIILPILIYLFFSRVMFVLLPKGVLI